METYANLPATWDIEIHQGSVWEWTGRIEAGADLVDTAGFAMEFTIAASDAEGAPIVATFDTTSGRCLTGIHTDGEHTVNWWIRLGATDTENLTPGVYWHNIWLTPADGPGNRTCFFAGTCCVEKGVRT